MAGLAAGSLLAPALVQLFGIRGALLATAALLPLMVLVGGRAITSLDAAARVPVVEIALLRSMEHLRALPTPELEGLAQLALRREYVDREVILRQGDPGAEFYAIAEGAVDVLIDGKWVATRRRPGGAGRDRTPVAGAPLGHGRCQGAGGPLRHQR